MELTN
jgi:hypothetical protein